jgi:phosphoenolpyruvate carboxykinase (GTP)
LVQPRPRRRALPLARPPRHNLRPLLWLLQLKSGQVSGRPTPVGILPTLDELDIDGVEITAGDLKMLLTIDVDRWRQEAHRERHLRQFTDPPDEIWQAHRRLAAGLHAAVR